MEPLIICPNCQNDDKDLIEYVRKRRYFCEVCGKTFIAPDPELENSRDTRRESQEDSQDTEEEFS